MDIYALAEHNRQSAWKILDETSVVNAWENIGATVNVVGSLKTGLMMKNRDIDLHIYTDELDIKASFSVISRLAVQIPLVEVQYKNLINTEEECIEWHAQCNDKGGNMWKLDMIHIRKGSKYDGVVEKVTDSIIKKLTPEIKNIILQIKNDVPDGVMIPGIEIYHAVFTGNVKNYQEMQQWRKTNPLINSLEYIP